MYFKSINRRTKDLKYSTVESVDTQNIIWTHFLSLPNRHVTVRNRDDGWLSVLREGKPETTQKHTPSSNQTHSRGTIVTTCRCHNPFPQMFWGIQRGQIFLTKRQEDLPSIVHHRAVVIGSFQVVSLDFVKVVLLPYYSEYKSIKTIQSY